MYEDTQAKLTATEELLKKKSQELASTSANLKDLKLKYTQLERSQDTLSTLYQKQAIELDTIKLAYQELKAAPPKQVEVLDLYSFGYQPYHYREKTFQQQLESMRTEIIDFRMENIYDLVPFLALTGLRAWHPESKINTSIRAFEAIVARYH